MADFHPFLVHFPIALLTFSLAVQVIGLRLRRNEATLVGWWTQLGGTAGILLAVGSGILAKSAASNAPTAVSTHEQLAFLTSAIMLGLAVWRAGLRGNLPRQRFLFFAVFTAGAVLMWLTATYGGEIRHHP